MKKQILMLALACGVLAALALPAAGQSGQQDSRWRWQDRDRSRDDHPAADRGQDKYRDRKAYQDGYRDGQQDRGKKSHPRGAQWKGDDRDAYNTGYRAGFEQRGDADRDRDRGIGDRGDRRPGGSQAYRNGYDDGLRYGKHDSLVRKPFKPTDSGAYEHGTNGYNRRYGSVDEYKREYRRGYEEGYQRGYRGR